MIWSSAPNRFENRHRWPHASLQSMYHAEADSDGKGVNAATNQAPRPVKTGIQQRSVCSACRPARLHAPPAKRRAKGRLFTFKLWAWGLARSERTDEDLSTLRGVTFPESNYLGLLSFSELKCVRDHRRRKDFLGQVHQPGGPKRWL